jgi:alcohol dehydrogenase class IV
VSFEFATAGRILFGTGAARQAAAAARSMGGRPLVVTGSRPERTAALFEGLECVTFRVNGEPAVSLIRDGAAVIREAQCDVVIAIGGGSVLDAGKALAALLTNPGDPLDYLEVIGKGQPLSNPSAPCIAIPTTAGTGSEVTRNAVLASPADSVKASLRSAHMLPRLAIVDPELTLDLPPAISAATGLDALTQLIEPYVSVRANPMADLYCVEGIRRAATALSRVWRNGHDRDARGDMCLASLFGGLALANAGLGAVHGFAAAVGGMFPAPHGAVCAALLPHVMAANVAALRSREPGSTALGRYDEVARLLTGQPHATADDGVRWVSDLCQELEIAPLRIYGIVEDHAEAVVARASNASSMKANPLTLTRAELREILARAM